jgi:DNA-binding response OmpR family regulator
VASKILIVAKNPGVTEVLETVLQGEGYDVVIAHDGIHALNVVQMESPDLVILDPDLAWLGGARVRQKPRPESPTPGEPLIVLSPKTEACERILPLPAGHDNATAGYDIDTLLERIKALQKRAAGAVRSTGILRAGVLEMDSERWTVSVEGEPVTLTAKEFGLLRMLLNASGRVLTRNLLREIVWGYGKHHQFDSRTVDVHIGRLRRKLGPAGHYICTVRDVGYRFNVTSKRADS